MSNTCFIHDNTSQKLCTGIKTTELRPGSLWIGTANHSFCCADESWVLDLAVMASSSSAMNTPVTENSTVLSSLVSWQLETSFLLIKIILKGYTEYCCAWFGYSAVSKCILLKHFFPYPRKPRMNFEDMQKKKKTNHVLHSNFFLLFC